MILSILAFLILFVVVVTTVGWFLSVPPYRGPKSAHFNGRIFLNGSGKIGGGGGNPLKLFLSEKRGVWRPRVVEKADAPRERVQGSELDITFINHATFLIQTAGLNILTDPVWSHRVSPFTWLGPRRYVDPGLSIDQLPEIDIILLSHNHYDHLDLTAWRQIYARMSPQVYTPLGNRAFLLSRGYKNIDEMDWWESLPLNGDLNLHCTPAQHFSGRGLFDRNRTLWSGFWLEGPSGSCYFAADTGYADFAKEIHERLGPPDVSILPIGAYKPEWFMKTVHTSPHEAVFLHKDLRSQQSIASHFGAFALGWESMHEAQEVLKATLEAEKIPPERFLIPREGHTFHFGREGMIE